MRKRLKRRPARAEVGDCERRKWPPTLQRRPDGSYHPRRRAFTPWCPRPLQTLRRAALPTGELRLKVREFVTELGRAGMPALFTDGGQFRVELPGSMAAVGTVAPGAACIIAALFPDALIGVLDEPRKA
jgi:hypothetical protein